MGTVRRDAAPFASPAQGQPEDEARGFASGKRRGTRGTGTRRRDLHLQAREIESGKEQNPPLPILNNCALALGVELDAVIEPEWRTWWNRYGGQSSPPDPSEFWHQPGRGTSDA